MAIHSHVDRQTFEALYLRLEKPIFNVVYRLLWSREESFDVTQETFVKFWAVRQSVDLTIAEPLLFRMALNRAKNRLRMQSVRRFFSGLVHESVSFEVQPEQALQQQRDQQAVRQALEGLPEKLKSVMLLTHWSGLSTAQVAQTLNIPEGTVSSRRSLAVNALRRRLKEDPFEEV